LFGNDDFWATSPVQTMGELDQNASNTIVSMALDGGINFIDTADGYSNGQSEEILGKALGKRRKDIILATKVRVRTGARTNDVGLSRHQHHRRM